MKSLILASTSKYRKELLDRLHLQYNSQSPPVDEEDLKKQHRGNLELSQFLSIKKAESCVGPNTVVIGADQLIQFEGQVIGKSGGLDKAFAQLKSMSGRTHELITSFCIIATHTTSEEKRIIYTNRTRMHMRNLSDEQIRRYLQIESPYDCAGSYKIEKFGMSLFEKIDTDDFTAIQGLPLIALINALKECGYEIP